MGGSLSRSDGRSRNDSGFEAEITHTVKRDYGFPDVGLPLFCCCCVTEPQSTKISISSAVSLHSFAFRLLALPFLGIIAIKAAAYLGVLATNFTLF